MRPAHPPIEEDTIAAVSTPPGIGAIAVVRVSGPEAVAVADRVFKGSGKLVHVKPQTVHHGYVVNAAGERLDEVLASVFAAPRSYTGEDLVELSCHGGALPAALVLDALLQAGARPAGPGEFTKRAFLSGRLDLSQAEAVAEVVAAKSRAGLKAALAQLDGALSQKVHGLRRGLVAVQAEIEARLDFAEEVEEPVPADELAAALAGVQDELDGLLEAAALGKLAREGARVVIAGRPNVGKSSLLNALVGRDRAIVTPVPGTTRDAIEDWVEIGGVLLTLADTAGLRPTEDFVEAEGVRRTRALVRESQLVLGVMEMPSPPTHDEISLIKELAREAPVIPVVNKLDLGGDGAGWEAAVDAARSSDVASHPILPCVFTSAVAGEGVAVLKGRVVEILVGRRGSLGADMGEVLLTNARHVGALRRAADALGRARDGLREQLSEELLAFEVGRALQALGEVSGESVTEDVLEEIFSRFCIGK